MSQRVFWLQVLFLMRGFPYNRAVFFELHYWFPFRKRS